MLDFIVDKDGDEPPRKRGRPRKVKPANGELTGTRATKVIDWITKYCLTPEGARVGQPMELLLWQKKFIEAIYDNPSAKTRRAILSVGRKNGKTSLTAAILLVHLCGPEARKNSQIYSAAQSRDQAALVFNLAAKMVRLHPVLRQVVLIHESNKSLSCPDLGTRYRALSAEATTAYGVSPALVVHDELGLVRGPRSELYEALETATGAQAEPLSIVISTQAANDQDLLSILIDDALAGHDPAVVCKLYTAPPEADPFDPDVIALANPSLGEFLSIKEVLAQAADAKRMPARESEYRNLILNQRVEVVNPFCSPDVWNACGEEVLPLEGADVYAGLDLAEVNDLTALVLIAKIDGKWQVHPTFWLPEEGLEQKAQVDRAPYDLWLKQGYLQTTPGRTVAYEYVAQHLRELFNRLKIKKLAFDRWNFRHLQPWLVQAGFSEASIKEHFVEFGQGYQSMSPALRELSQILLDHNLCHGQHPVLKSCVANTVIVIDDAKNKKPSKRKSTGRIDGLVALAMAVGVAPLQPPKIDIEALIGIFLVGICLPVLTCLGNASAVL
jgi:phage terminase large subunit-like protein